MCPLEIAHDLAGRGFWEVEPNQSLAAREVERMMKLQDVILKVMVKKISWLSERN
jgi:hypothetical protein